MANRRINLVVALPAEARPLRHHLGLNRHDRIRDWPLYGNDRISLVVCGVGVRGAAEATRWLGVQQQGQTAAWMNLGIAGHPTRPVGQAVLIDRIMDGSAPGREWQLPVPAGTALPFDRLVSLSEPSPDYRIDALSDMEAAGFYGAALELAPPSRILCLKLVSDNRARPARLINGRMVSELIGNHLPTLDHLLALLGDTP